MASLLAIRAAARAVPGDRQKSEDWRAIVATVHLQMRSIVGPTRDLEDLTQAALEQVARRFEAFEGRARFSTFTYRICANVAQNHWRSWRRWLARFDRTGDDDASPVDAGASAPDRLLEDERRKKLYAALEKIPPKMRLTLTLVDLEELSVTEVAEILECGEPTVRSRLATARHRLYEILRRDAAFAPEGLR